MNDWRRQPQERNWLPIIGGAIVVALIILAGIYTDGFGLISRDASANNDAKCENGFLVSNNCQDVAAKNQIPTATPTTAGTAQTRTPGANPSATATPTTVPTRTPTVEPTPFDQTACKDRDLKPGDSVVVEAGCRIVGDVEVNGEFRARGVDREVTFVECQNPCQVTAKYGASVSGRSLNALQEEKLRDPNGCGQGIKCLHINRVIVRETMPGTTTGTTGTTTGTTGGSIWGQGIENKTVLGDTGQRPEFVRTYLRGAWRIYEGPRLSENPIVANWVAKLRDPAPGIWKYFPNVPNPDVMEFRVVKCVTLPGNEGVDPNKDCVPWGLEYGEDEAPFCENNPCDDITPARSYNYYSGPYSEGGFTSMAQSPTDGDIRLMINVMDRSVTFREQFFDNGFRVMGRYWDGDNLEWGVWGIVSNGAAAMLNMTTFSHPGEKLNFGGNPNDANAGANCGRPEGCQKVFVRVIVVAGTDALVWMETTVTKTGNQAPAEVRK